MAQEHALSEQLTYSPSMANAKNYMRWVLSPFLPYVGNAVLEIGVGHGGYRDFLPPVKTYTGIDIDPSLVQEARERYPATDYLQADATDPKLAEFLQGRTFDTVLCLNVLEHIQDDAAAVRNLMSVLNPGGHLLLFVPAFQALYSSLDAHAGHHRRYTLADLRALVPPAQGEVVAAKYFNALGAIGWYVNKAFKHKSLDAPSVDGQLKFFDQYLVPLAKLIDIPFNSLFGQSALIVVRRA